ncbi:MAG: hypothetical protein LKF81_11100 [Prevotella sp.]|nr:hypothetical protein [Prevotella sp.]
MLTSTPDLTIEALMAEHTIPLAAPAYGALLETNTRLRSDSGRPYLR